MVLMVRVQIETFELPIGAASESDQIWTYLNEEPVGTQRGVTLGRNGIRIGVGRAEDWPDLARVLKRLKGRRVLGHTITSLPGATKVVMLQAKQPPQDVFTFYEDLTGSGKRYPAGDAMLAISTALNEDDISSVQITGMPQIRSSEHRPRIIRERSTPRIVDRPELFNFEPLTFRLEVPSGGFVVIGPSAEAQRPHSVGRSFLISKRKGMSFETVLLLMPKVRRVWAEVPAGSASVAP